MTIVLTNRDNKKKTIDFFDAVAINTTGVNYRTIIVIDNDGNYHEYNLNEWNITAIN